MNTVVLRNRYRVSRRLGAGGVGSVYRVRDLQASGHDGPELALKALFSRSGERSLLESLRLEFRVLATLRHPLIARVYDFGSIPADSGLEGSDGRPGYFFTRDLIDGQDLEHHCAELSVREICQVVQRTAEVLDVLHRAGMIHGDFKPANVIVSPDGRPHLIDFGLVRSEGQSSVTSGTAAYIAPELLREQLADRRADLYAVGISLFQLLARRMPLPGANLGELMAWHLNGDPLQAGPYREELPPAVDEVVRRLTERDPDRRYPTAAEVALALAEAAGAEAEPGPDLFVPPAPGENLTAPLERLEAAVHERVLGRRAPRGEDAVLMVLEGEAGAGKTTLLQELAWRCQLAGAEVARAESRPGDPRPLGPWFDLLGQVAGAVGEPHPLEGRPRDDVDRYALYQRIGAYLARAAERTPLLLLLDGCDQIAEEGLAALRFISHTLEPHLQLLIVAAGRTDEARCAELGSPPRLRLGPLSAADVQRMLADASGRRDDVLGERIQTHTGGNPLFLIDVLRRLREAGWPTNPDLQRLAPPRSLEQTYIARLHELGADERAVLESLAVLGRPATGLLLLEIAQADEEAQLASQVGLPMERLETLDWLDRSPEGAYAFRQGPASRILYDQLDPARRRQLHRAVSTALAAAGGPRDSVEATRHAIGAGALDLARQTFDDAVAELRGQGGHRGAIQLYRGMVELTREAGVQAPGALRLLRRELGELYHTVGDYDRAVEALERACQGARGAELDSSTIALARVHLAAGRAAKALELLEHVLGSADARATDRVTALAEAANAHIALDDHEPAVRTVRAGLELLDEQARRTGEAAVVPRAELQGQLGHSLGYLQRYDEANQAFEAALRDARAGNDRRVEANILNRWAILAFRQADLSSVPERYEGALACARHTGDVERQAAIQLNLAVFHLHQGEYAAALAHLPESLRLFQAIGARKNLAHARCNLGLLELRLGLTEQARTTLRQAIEASRAVGWPAGEALSRLLLGLVQARRGHLDEARASIGEARALSQQLGQPRDAADALLDLAHVELEAGNVDRALAALRQAEGEVELQELPDLRARAAALQARAASCSADVGLRANAVTALDSAFSVVRELGSPELTWGCHGAAMVLADSMGRPGIAARHAALAAAVLEQMARDLPGEAQAAFWQDPHRRAARDRAALHRSAAEAGAPMNDSDSIASDATVASLSDTEPPLAELASGETLLASGTLPPPGAVRGAAAAAEERFYRLLEIYRQINSELDHERLLGIVMDTAVELTGAERGFLLLGDSADSLEVEVARNLDLEGETGVYSRSIAERVFTAGQPVITVSAHNDPRFKEYLSVHQLQLESVLCIPIHAHSRVAGVLYMESRFQSGRFTPEDQRLLMAFGDQVAIALTNARLLADNIRKAEELEQAKAEIEALAEERGRLLRQRTRQLQEAQHDLAETRAQLRTRTGKFGMIGRSAPMLKLFQLVERVAATDVPVLVEGESGTGKEMVARAIHQTSPRSGGRLVSVNCAAIPENLLESELFGHVRGAFTGADRERKGLFAVAHGGTLFLDEIGDMPARMQVDLLRALQEKTIRPIGSQQDLQVDVRVIAASNKPLARLVQQGAFREDLYYRLNVVTLKLPPLRERSDDIPLLVDHFLTNIGEQMGVEKKRLTRDAMRLLVEYGWPGNVRQLEHTLMNASVLADGELLDAPDFSLDAPVVKSAPAAAETAPGAAAGAPARPTSVQDHRERERQQILDALERAGWNKSRAARLLEMPRRTFYRRLKEHGIQ